eukprot:CAMPEP_0202868024 /NCGR_PEP_ID=MMETSP1391-20130828/10000_1 /ASSEMBLY_ACC=CAM_ASM_000867 /TAXON_ID=1034604 /ORGANISM="Chlamydomonas leiostraca, Strain SAG 11-49" /LENGTH=149 /DNA_ID=CAMNT_0049548121 /DNA_START=258 /DNA_END=709 /DNA_ORIENTATION=-
MNMAQHQSGWLKVAVVAPSAHHLEALVIHHADACLSQLLLKLRVVDARLQPHHRGLVGRCQDVVEVGWQVGRLPEHAQDVNGSSMSDTLRTTFLPSTSVTSGYHVSTGMTLTPARCRYSGTKKAGWSACFSVLHPSTATVLAAAAIWLI